MDRDPPLTLERVNPRLRALRDQATRLRADRDRLSEDLAQKREEVAQLADRAVKLAKVGDLFRVLLDKLVLDQVGQITSTVTAGLRAILPDQNLAFVADMDQRNGKVCVDFSLTRGDPERLGHKSDPLEGFGGGPVSVASLLLRVLLLLRMKRHPVLFLDETVGALSDEYIDACGQFLSRLSKQLGIDILLIIHKPAYLDHATVGYQGSEAGSDKDGTAHLVVKQVKGTP